MSHNNQTRAGVVILLLGVFLAGIFFVAGCQTIDKQTPATAQSSVCPTCKTELRTTAITHMKYTQDICPMCKQVSTLDPQQEDILRGYVGLGSDAATVHVCDHCKAMVEKCPICRAKAQQP